MLQHTGDGHLITFDGPTQAIRCAEALRADVEALGIEIRIGIHTGECELLDTDIGGLAVHIAARIVGQAGAGEILVSRTVRDLVVGSGTASRTAAASSCVACPAPGNSWRSIATARGRDLPRRNWYQRRPPALAPRCAARIAPWPRWPGARRGFCAAWPASPRPLVADEQRYVEPRRGLRPHTVRNSDRCNVKAGRPRRASVSDAKPSFTKSVPSSAQNVPERSLHRQ